MTITSRVLLIALALAANVQAATPAAKANEAATARYLASLVAGAEPNWQR